EELENGDVYLIGAFSFGEVLNRYKMKYNPTYGTYELQTLLKQGYYNYMYGFVPKGKTVADLTPIEGSFAEAENDYTIYVYLRENGDIAHKLVGVSFVNSMKDR